MLKRYNLPNRRSKIEDRKSNKVRVRFAPSPTGYLHIGNARTAFFNWLYARKEGGNFILRIEDTDRGRSSERFERIILEDMRWMGLEWDEGPDCGGGFGPYRQSERLNIYKEYASQLIEDGKAYNCYCTPDELEKRRDELLGRGIAPKYDGRCRNLSEKERIRYEEEGRRPAIRFIVEEGMVEVDDIIKGNISFNCNTIGDFIILRSDSVASYNFAAVIDDALMEITHIIRGEDHLPNTPRQILLNRALGFPPPMFAHLSTIMGHDRMQLSKRHNGVSIEYLKKKGFLPEALLNYLSLLGWSPGGEVEIIPLEDIIKRFSLERASKGAAIFDPDKLKWMNSIYIRNMDLERLTDILIPFIRGEGVDIEGVDRGWLERMVDTIRDNIETLTSVSDYIDIFFGTDINICKEGIALLKDNSAIDVIKAVRDEIREVDSITHDIYIKMVSSIKKRMKLEDKRLFMPIRVALTGRTKGPRLDRIFPLIDKEILLKRVDKALDVCTQNLEKF
ncbi:MAG: glutamate--tRNA ligase [Nitrospinae bacterium]|nr:glutamate--tRNA ligase [Nitrospinota bacterium]